MAPVRFSEYGNQITSGIRRAKDGCLQCACPIYEVLRRLIDPLLSYLQGVRADFLLEKCDCELVAPGIRGHQL